MMQLGSIAIYVANIEQTVEFYEQAFGLTCRYRDPAGNSADLETGDTTLTFVNERMERTDLLGLSPNRLGGNAPGTVLVFYTANVDETYNRAIAVEGGENASEPYTKLSGERAAYIRDPNGIVIELTEIPARIQQDANRMTENEKLEVSLA